MCSHDGVAAARPTSGLFVDIGQVNLKAMAHHIHRVRQVYLSEKLCVWWRLPICFYNSNFYSPRYFMTLEQKEMLRDITSSWVFYLRVGQCSSHLICIRGAWFYAAWFGGPGLKSKRSRIIRPKPEPKPNIRLPLKEPNCYLKIFGSGLTETELTCQTSPVTEFWPNIYRSKK